MSQNHESSACLQTLTSGTITRPTHNQTFLGDSIQPEDNPAGLPAAVSASAADSNLLNSPFSKPALEQNIPSFPLRLIILVPARNLDTAKLAGQISHVVQQHKCNLLFLSAVKDSTEESCANAYMAALINLASRLPVEVERKMVWNENWVNVVKGIGQAGDLVICPTEQSNTIDGKRIPLGIALSQESEIPVLMFEGYYYESPLRSRTGLAEIKWWSIAVMIVAVSTGLQGWILRNVKGWSGPVLLGLSLIVEYGVLWIWNRSG